MEGYNHAADHVSMIVVRKYDTCELLVSYY